MFSLLKLLCQGVLVASLFYSFSAFSYEDAEPTRRAIITQHNDNLTLTATDSVGRKLGSDFDTLIAPAYAPPANGLRNDVNDYIDARIVNIANNLPTILIDLSMDSALYTHRQKIEFDSEDYHINYSMLVQASGDYVVLEKRLIPANPIFLAIYYVLAKDNPTGDTNYNKVYVYQSTTPTTSMTQSDLIYSYDVESYHTDDALNAAAADVAGNIMFNNEDAHLCPLGALPDGHITENPDVYETYVDNGNTNVKVYCNMADDTIMPILEALADADGNDMANVIDDDGNAIAIDINRVQGMLYGVVDNLRAAESRLVAIANLVTSSVCSSVYNDVAEGSQTNWELISSNTQADISYYLVDIETQEARFLQKNVTDGTGSLLFNKVDIQMPITINFSAISTVNLLPETNTVVVFPIDDIYDINNNTTVTGVLSTPGEIAASSSWTVTIPEVTVQESGFRYANYEIKLQFAITTGDGIHWDSEQDAVNLAVDSELCIQENPGGNNSIDVAVHVYGTIGSSISIKNSALGVDQTGGDVDFFISHSPGNISSPQLAIIDRNRGYPYNKAYIELKGMETFNDATGMHIYLTGYLTINGWNMGERKEEDSVVGCDNEAPGTMLPAGYWPIFEGPAAGNISDINTVCNETETGIQDINNIRNVNKFIYPIAVRYIHYPNDPGLIIETYSDSHSYTWTQFENL